MVWVSWDNVCKHKKEGGLRIKNIKTFNLTLLGKWDQRLLLELHSFWVKIIKAKYGASNALLCEWGWNRGSLWWRDLGRMCNIVNLEGWFCKNLKRKIGGGDEIKLEEGWWEGERALKKEFPKLCVMSYKNTTF